MKPTQKIAEKTDEAEQSSGRSARVSTMSSSVASGKHMERWAAERREKSATAVPVAAAARRNFSSFQPDMEQLEKFEEKVHRHVERQEMKESELETEAVINVMGSTAGAGSGDFHMYRGYRTKEMARLKDFEQRIE